MTSKLWQPSPERIAQANLTAFAAAVGAKHGVDVGTYAKLWQWSVDHKWDFWRDIWDYGGVLGAPGDRVLEDAERMPGARWFPDARLNFAQNLLERRAADDDDDALVFWGEDKIRRVVSHAELHALASRVAAALDAQGVTAGDRIAAYMPNMPETYRRHAWSDGARRDLVVVVAGFRRAGRARPLRADRAARSLHGRRLLVQRQADPDSRQGQRDRGEAAVGRAGRRGAVSAAGLRPASRLVRRARRGGVGRVARAVSRGPDRLRAAAVRSSALHPLLVGHHRRAEVHRARRGRHVAAAPEGAPAARRREAGRSALLLHDVRLDDVELARLRPRQPGARSSCTTGRRSSIAGGSCGSSRTPNG